MGGIARIWMFFNPIIESFASERNQYFLWIPVIFGLGILTYFSIGFEPDLKLSFIICLLPILSSLFLYKYQTLGYRVFLVLSIFAVGFFVTNVRANWVKAPKIPYEKAYEITGKIKDIVPLETGNRLIIQVKHIDNLESSQTPKYLRVTARTKLNGALIGDNVSLKAIVSPPPLPVIDGGYDFSRYAYFEQIGGVGYSISDLTILTHKAGSVAEKLANLRSQIGLHVIAVLGPRVGNIATSLMIGQFNAIDEDLAEAWRISGITHILSVSGMHISLVIAVFFFATRFLLSLFEYPSLYWNNKKIAAFVALGGSFFYLTISGMQVAAIRSFLMSSLIVLAILLDRTAIQMRTVALAALLILLVKPENLMSVSFQMSFAAVCSLIAFYQYYVNYIARYINSKSYLLKAPVYVAGVAFSSLLAGLATAPFSIYYFNQYSNYSILANIIAVPLTSLVVMPMVVLAFLLYPFGIDGPALKIMGWGIEATNYVALEVTKIKGSLLLIPQISEMSFGFIVFGFIWLALWEGKKRLVGIAIILSGVYLAANTNHANLLINPKERFFALKTADYLIFSRKRVPEYTKEAWQKYYGLDSSTYFGEHEELNELISCDSESCLINVNNETISVNYLANSLKRDCSRVKYMLNLSNVKIINEFLQTPNKELNSKLTSNSYESDDCPSSKVVLESITTPKNGVYMVFFDADGWHMSSNINKLRKRIWNET